MKLDALPKEIRTADRFVAIHDAREEAAREARGCQTQYKRAMAGFILATALAAILGGFVLYGLDTPPESAADGPYLKQLMSGKAMHVSLAVLQAVSLAIAAFFGYLLNKVKYDEEWLEHRLRAEQGRLDRASAALEIGYEVGPTAFRAGAEYFSSELIDGQLEFFKKSIARHAKSAQRLILAVAIVVAIGVLALGLNGLGISAFVLFAALVGVVSPAFISAMKSWEAASASKENQKQYSATWHKLNMLRAERQTFWDAVDKNDLTAAKEYAEQVSGVLKVDHQEFAALRKGVVPVAAETDQKPK